MSYRKPAWWLPAHRYGYENNRANQLLTFKAFASPSGVANLDSDLTINSVTVSPDDEFNGGVADATNWIGELNATTLTLQAGTAPTYNNGSPCLGSADDSVLLNAGGYYKAGNTTFGNIGTNDAVFRLLFKSTGTTSVIAAKRNAGVGWEIGIDANDKLYLTLEDSGGSVTTVSAALVSGVWNFAEIFTDRSGSCQIYINKTASGAAVDISGTALTLDSATSFCIGADSGGNSPYDSNVAYFSMYQGAAWLDSHLQATVTATDSSKLTGTYPQVAAGTALPTTATRTYPAYLDKVESDGTSKLYQVGAEWMRQCSRKDANGVELKGYLPESAVQNVALQSENTSITWALLDAGDSFDLNAIEAPNGETTMDGLIADATDGEHGITQDCTLTATSTAISCFAKKGDKNWICIEDSTIANCKAFFDIDNGVVGSTPGAGVDALYIEPGYNNDTVRCIAIVTGTAAAHTIKFKSANADNDDDFSGDGSTVNTYMWGFQVECNGLGYATSYIPTTTAAATRLKDELEYVAGANIGGEDVGMGAIACSFLYPDYDVLTSRYIFALSDGASALDFIASYAYVSGDLLSLVSAASGGNAGSAPKTGDIVDGIIHNMQARYTTNSLKLIVDGAVGSIDSSVDIPDDIDQIDIGQAYNGTAQAACLISNIRIYKEPTDGN